MNAYVYLRASTDEQADGLKAQRDACLGHAERQGWPVAGLHTDEGIGGATGLDKRPALLEALSCMTKGDVLLVAKRDRIGRDPMAIAMIEAAVARKRCRIVSVAGEGTEGDDPTSVLMRRMVDAFGEYERLIIKARTKAALQAKKRRGERVGQVPLGYDATDNGMLEVNPAEQSAIGTVHRLRAEGLSIRKIADRMNYLGIPTKENGRWHIATVQRALNLSPIPCGPLSPVGA